MMSLYRHGSREKFVHIVYLDDSGSCGDSSSRDSRYQLVLAAIVKDEVFLPLEEYFGLVIEEFVPEDLRDTFEFHAEEVFHRKGHFRTIENADRALEILENCVSIVHHWGIPIIYGAVDRHKLREEHYSTANPVDWAFRLCVEGVEHWFRDTDPDGLGILICDDSRPRQQEKNGKQQQKQQRHEESSRGQTYAIQRAFRSYRKRQKSFPADRGKLPHLHDDMYFGNSTYSVGIQLADVCAFLTMRHLIGKSGTEHLYDRWISRTIRGVVEPAP